MAPRWRGWAHACFGLLALAPEGRSHSLRGVLRGAPASQLQADGLGTSDVQPLAWGPENPAMAGWSGLRRLDSDPFIVVSLTTVPGGVLGLLPTLRSLRNQTLPPDAIELNLPLKSKRGLGDYPTLPTWEAVVVDVHRTEDWLALTNIVPTVQRAKARAGRRTTLVIVVDDDKVYPDSLVEDHLRAHRAQPHSASTCRGYKVPPGGDISPAVFWPGWDELGHSVYGHNLASAVPQRVGVMTGSDSWSAPVDVFSESLWNDLSNHAAGAANGTIGSAASLMNDVWISGQLSRQGVPKFVVPCRRECRDAPKNGQRQAQNLAQQRRGLNQIVMQFYLQDWAPDEIMSVNEIKIHEDLVEPIATPPPPNFLVWVGHGVAGVLSAIFLGN
mmetsp:Transcript_19863/g.42336  ORF Transcript_19863/g.42336 Transcript_19863/m.42336 type:complete len:386 (+) Transcript_19863:122-1279(+)